MTVELAAAAGVELSLAVAVGGSAAGVSTGAGVALGAGAGGTEATALPVFGSELCVEGTDLIEGTELDAVSPFEVGVLLVLAAMEASGSAFTLAFAGDECEADARLERLEVLLLAALLDAAFAAGARSSAGGDAVAARRLGACCVAVPVSASVTALFAMGAAGVFGAELLASATIGVRFADGGAVFSEPLRL